MDRAEIDAVIDLACFVTGACLFSFLNVLIYRIPRKQPYWKGRSRCTSCGHVLGALDLVPVFSYLALRGRCRYCGEKISPRYAAVELLGGAAAVLCFWKHGCSVSAAVAFCFFFWLALIAFVDADTMEIPNGFVLAVAALAVLSALAGMEPNPAARLVGAFCVSVPMLLMALAIPGAFGGGDIKLMAASGLLLGWKLELIAMFLAVLCGGGCGIWLLASGKKKKTEHFAFGPFLCAGMAAAWLCGEQLLGWYLGLFGL